MFLDSQRGHLGNRAVVQVRNHSEGLPARWRAVHLYHLSVRAALVEMVLTV
jgi:hypothetical protein